MMRTTVNVDHELLAGAQQALGTTGLSETVNAAMADVARRAALARFSVRDFDITDADLADARADRTTVDD